MNPRPSLHNFRHQLKYFRASNNHQARSRDFLPPVPTLYTQRERSVVLRVITILAPANYMDHSWEHWENFDQCGAIRRRTKRISARDLVSVFLSFSAQNGAIGTSRAGIFTLHRGLGRTRRTSSWWFEWGSLVTSADLGDSAGKTRKTSRCSC